MVDSGGRNLSNEYQIMKNKIDKLQERIEYLRVSRRVLMNLVEKLEREKNGMVAKLEKENRRLQKYNLLYAQSILEKNKRIVELEESTKNKDCK